MARHKLKKVTMLFPLRFNDGSIAPREIFLELRRQLFVLCGGFTDEGTNKGAYRMDDGKKQIDVSQKLFVIVKTSELNALRKIVRDAGRKLKQESMYFEISDVEVEFLR